MVLYYLFTGDPRKPGTLHYLHKDGSKNDYEKAISAIVGILQKYDTDQSFPVWGFGAKYGGVVRHCFQCGPTEEVHGVEGVINAYHQVFQSGLVMSGPTVFTEVIETAAARAISAQVSTQRRVLKSLSPFRYADNELLFVFLSFIHRPKQLNLDSRLTLSS